MTLSKRKCPTGTPKASSFITVAGPLRMIVRVSRKDFFKGLAFSLLSLALAASSLYAARSPVVRIIVVDKQSEAENILAEINKGGSFASLAKERSVDKKSRDRYGEIEASAFERLDEPLKKAALKLGEGEVSGVIALGDNRYALALVVDMTHYRKGTRAFRSGDFKAAEKDLLKHVELNPDAVKARVILGRIYETGNEANKAEASYREALQFDPGCEAAYERLGALYLLLGKFQQAKDLYDDGLHHLPDSKSLRTAVEKIKKRLSYVKSEPPKKETGGTEPRGGHEIPKVDAQKSGGPKPDNSKKELPPGEALKDRPSTSGTSNNMADRKMHIRIIFAEKESDAQDILSQVKEGKPFALLAKERSVDEKTREAYGYLGEVSVDSLHTSIQEALSKLKEGQTSGVIKIDQNRYAVVQATQMDLYREGEKAFIAGNYITAEGKLLKYVENNPDAAKACAMLGKIYEDRKEPSKAIEMYKEAIAFSPRTVLVYERLARVYLFLGMYQKAKDVYIQGLSQVPSSPVLEEGIEMADLLLIGNGERTP
jgi:tetratricopeptide (TPR) repeat protein